ncbi:transcription factor bHLH113-like [Canna indica]|uniref:Transcription factor bHLH113-like n=1 Tax=Canna indica TaxID=4628 RepID=A0AAQ3K0J0_9LILI|nr:transcription factor bHLH113-like [Canna indica]
MDREDEGFDHMEEGGFMELLSSGGEDSGSGGGGGGGFLFGEPSPLVAAQMLCFGGKDEDDPLPLHGVLLAQKSSDNSFISSSSPPPPPPPAMTGASSSSSKLSKKKDADETGGRSRTTATSSKTITAIKKPKTESSAAAGRGSNKARKEKLGDRIMALQKLVSPFGKSDTASVLHEALGYIRFLHDQVQVLSSPYLHGLPSGDRMQEGREQGDLRSRGLCLVPVSCTEHVTSSNGADLWSPTAMGSSKSSSSISITKH